MDWNLGKIGKTLGVLALATDFSLEPLLSSFPATKFWKPVYAELRKRRIECKAPSNKMIRGWWLIKNNNYCKNERVSKTLYAYLTYVAL